MSGDPGWPFDTLGLDGPGADKRAIRKAYATRLKKIDQAADPQGFQELRRAYEFALMIAEAPTEDDTRPDAPPGITLDEAAPPPPQPAPDPPPDPAAVAQAEAEQAHMEAIGQLAERVSTFTRGEQDIDRLTRILHDPLLLDPQASATVEQAIYDYLFEAVNEDSFGYPGFKLRDKDGQYSNASEADGMRALLDQLDASFGWMSDQVRMQGRFWGYDQFLDAAFYLGAPRFSAPPAESSGPNWGRMFLYALFGLVLLSKLVATFPDRPTAADTVPPRTLVTEGAIAQVDRNFLVGVGASRSPSLPTAKAVEALMIEQGFAEDTRDRVSLIVARNWAQRAILADHAWQDQTGYNDRHDGLKYLTGVFLATRYQLSSASGYLDPAPFNLDWTPDLDGGIWRVTPGGRDLSAFWPEGGGYMLAEAHAPDATTFRAVYPARFIHTMRRWTGDDRRALEGALGLKAFTLDQTPALKLFGFPQLDLSSQAYAQVDLASHHLVQTGLAENRWPLRASPVPHDACEVITFVPDLIITETDC